MTFTVETSKRLFAQDRVPRAGERNDITHVAWRMDKFTEVIFWVRESQKASYGTKSPNPESSVPREILQEA